MEKYISQCPFHGLATGKPTVSCVCVLFSEACYQAFGDMIFVVSL